MNPTGKYLAMFVGTPESVKMTAWRAMPDDQRRKKEQEGMAAWGAWMQKHQGAIVDMGGPLGKTKSVSASGVQDASNQLSGYVVIRAGSVDEASKLFENHPHFANFPGERVEIMPILAVPGM